MTKDYRQLIGSQDLTFCACGRVVNTTDGYLCDVCAAGLVAADKRESEAEYQNYCLGRVA